MALTNDDTSEAYGTESYPTNGSLGCPEKSGIVVLGNIDPKLVQKVRIHCISPNTKQSRYQRQTELEWNGDCDPIVEYFETVSHRELAQYPPSF